MIEALEQTHRHGIAIDETTWRIQVSLVESLERHWRQHDRVGQGRQGPARGIPAR